VLRGLKGQEARREDGVLGSRHGKGKAWSIPSSRVSGSLTERESGVAGERRCSRCIAIFIVLMYPFPFTIDGFICGNKNINVSVRWVVGLSVVG